jgi:CheY-like chemotaxis protein
MTNDAVEAVRPLIEARGHSLEVHLPDPPPPLVGDATRLCQVLVNLLSNAAKYTPDGGRIRIGVEVEEDKLVLRVSDTGIGIPAGLLPRMFDLFRQGDRSLDRQEGGLGIGLTLVRRLVELHGGSVVAASAGEGQGSELTVRLPLSAGAAPLEEPPAPAPPAPAAARRVLVVDDNRDGGETLAVILRFWGHEVRVCEDGPGALAEAADFRPEVVLLDIGLPGMDGYEVARRLRERFGPGAMRLIALTGYGNDTDRRRSLEVGFDEHLTKPAELGELRRLLGSV